MIDDTSNKLDAIVQLGQSVAEEKDAAAVFHCASQTAATCIGYDLCTIMLFDAQAMEVERLYSSNPAAYPTGGRKQKRDTEWGRHVLENGQPYIGRNLEDIRQHFDDHKVIQDLGLHSILNMPIKIGGRTIGTMNLTSAKEDYYSEQNLPMARLITSLIASRIG
jgi:GAF domain-containing protein